MKDLELDYHLAMANVYDLLREVFFNRWTEDSIKSITEKAELLNSYFIEFPFIENLKNLNGNKLDIARWEYNRLFIGPRKPLAPPFESVYRSSKHLQMQSFTFGVREYYAQVGLEVAMKDQFPDDFIGFEFQYLFYISHLLVNLLQNGKEDEKNELLAIKKEFLNEHLGQWIDKFCKDIMKESREEIWINLAKFILEVFEKEDKYLIAS